VQYWSQLSECYLKNERIVVQYGEEGFTVTVAKLMKNGDIMEDGKQLKDECIDTGMNKARDGWPRDGSVESKWEKL